MTRRRGFSLLAGALALAMLIVVVRVSARVPSAAERAECQALGGGSLVSQRVAVRSFGVVPACGDDREATRAFVKLHRLMGELGPALAPASVGVELTDAGDRIEAQPAAQRLVISRAAVEASGTIWLHELAHLRAAGARPRAAAAAHLARAIDEAFADYVAAIVSGESLVGSGHAAARDLSRAPRIPVSEWALLGFARFDAHRFGWALAGALWRREPRARDLLADMARGLAGDALAGAESPAAVLHALVARCPARSRPLLSAALHEWAPPELFIVLDAEGPYR